FGAFHRRGGTLEIADGTKADVQIELLAQGHVQGADSLARRGRQETLYGHMVFADRLQGVLGKQVGWAVASVNFLGLLSRKNLKPFDFAAFFVAFFHGRVENPLTCFPDVRAGAVSLDKGDDGTLGHLENTAGNGDFLAFFRWG